MTVHAVFFNNQEVVAPNSSNRAVGAVRGNGSQLPEVGYTYGDGFGPSKLESQEFSAGGNQLTHVAKEYEHQQDLPKGNTAGHLTLFSVQAAATTEYKRNFSLGFGKPLIYKQYPPTEQCYGIYSTFGSEAVFQGHAVLPLSMASDGGPIFVNPKQYNGIIRRRKSRAKAEMENKVATVRKPYQHFSRHLHAMRRPRGTGGRFLNTKGPKSSMEEANKEGKKQPPCSESQTSEVLQYSDGGGMKIHRSASLLSEVTSHLFSGNAPFQSFCEIANTGLSIAMAAAVSGNFLKV